MASLYKTYDNQKLLGQVYTPRFIVEKILDAVGYSDFAGFSKSILDPACGDGRFLEIVVQRILENVPKADWENCFSKIQGWDVDAEAIEQCRANLDARLEPHRMNYDWKLCCFNPILEKENLKERFDFIVGNPPYIRIQHLDLEQRQFIQTHYAFCKKGSTDIYIAFFELCQQLLSENGQCGLITPNTYFYTETGKSLRQHFQKQKTIHSLTNYGAIQLFDNATTYSAITVFGKMERENFAYEEAQDKREFKARTIPFSEIEKQKTWALSAKKEQSIKGKRLGDICNIHVGLTTLCDRAYILQLLESQGNTMRFSSRLKEEIELESALVCPIVKASTLKNPKSPITDYILFPYEKREGKMQIIPENELSTRFPKAYKYLLSVRPELDKRDAGKPNKVAWYAYGRSQGLETSFGKKILFSPMNKAPNFMLHEAEEATFYSGYCIKYDGDYGWLLKQLNSQRMADFVGRSSRDFRGGWKAYSKRVLEDFLVEVDQN